MPNWIVGIILLGIAIWRINGALKYRDPKLFLEDFGGNWIDQSKLPRVIRSYLYIEISVFILLPIFPFLTYVKFLHPYLWHIAIGFLSLWTAAFIIWFMFYSAKKA